MTRILTELAPAKLNLFLHCLRKRPDGYHEIESLMVFCSLVDKLSVCPAPQTSLTLKGPFAQDVGGDNLVLKALSLMNEACGRKDAFTIELEKNIPVGAGLGGGSADAAAMMRLYGRVTGVNFSEQQIHEIALKLGADVMPCFVSKPLIARGIGEDLEFCPFEKSYYVVLVKPPQSLSAAEVYKAGPTFSEPLSEMLLEYIRHPEPLLRGVGSIFSSKIAALEDKKVKKERWIPHPLKGVLNDGLGCKFNTSLLRETRNDLERPAIQLVPDLNSILSRLAKTENCLLARVSGSGTVCFGLYEKEEQAKEAAKEFKDDDYWVTVTKIV